MKKIFLLLVLFIGLMNFNYSSAAVCASGYTEINVLKPNNGSQLWVGYNGAILSRSNSINDIAYFKGFTGSTCYKLLSTSLEQTQNLYEFNGTSYVYNSNYYKGSQESTNFYDFIASNYIPEIISLSHTGTISSFNNIQLEINGVTDLSNGQELKIYESWDGVNFSIFSGSINTPIANKSINFSVDATGKKIGSNTLYVKLHDGKTFSNTINLNIETGEIYIDTTGLIKGSNKTIKATSNGGDLFYSITNDSTCNNSLTFNDYTELSFNSTSSNGIRVCYKSVLNNNSMFQLSEKIEGAGIKTTPIKKSNLFDSFLNWQKGGLKDFDPLYILITSQISNSIQGSTTSTNYPKMLTDVNGDGLPDLLLTNYVREQKLYYSPGVSSPSVYYEPQYYYALLLNKGNMDFEVKYRCVYLGDTSFNMADTSRIGYYGDCVE